jgi:hypothetical protein
MKKPKKMNMNEAKRPMLDILDARETGSIKTDEEMEAKIYALLNNPDIKAALFKGDDLKSWYSPLSEWKKAKFNEAYRKWNLTSK